MLVVVFGTVVSKVACRVASDTVLVLVTSTVACTVAGKVTVDTVLILVTSIVGCMVAGKVAPDTVPIAVTTTVAGAMMVVADGTVVGGKNSSPRDRLQWSVLILILAGMVSANLIACVALAFI